MPSTHIHTHHTHRDSETSLGRQDLERGEGPPTPCTWFYAYGSLTVQPSPEGKTWMRPGLWCGVGLGTCGEHGDVGGLLALLLLQARQALQAVEPTTKKHTQRRKSASTNRDIRKATCLCAISSPNALHPPHGAVCVSPCGAPVVVGSRGAAGSGRGSPPCPHPETPPYHHTQQQDYILRERERDSVPSRPPRLYAC